MHLFLAISAKMYRVNLNDSTGVYTFDINQKIISTTYILRNKTHFIVDPPKEVIPIIRSREAFKVAKPVPEHEYPITRTGYEDSEIRSLRCMYSALVAKEDLLEPRIFPAPNVLTLIQALFSQNMFKIWSICPVYMAIWTEIGFRKPKSRVETAVIAYYILYYIIKTTRMFGDYSHYNLYADFRSAVEEYLPREMNEILITIYYNPASNKSLTPSIRVNYRRPLLDRYTAHFSYGPACAEEQNPFYDNIVFMSRVHIETLCRNPANMYFYVHIMYKLMQHYLNKRELKNFCKYLSCKYYFTENSIDLTRKHECDPDDPAHSNLVRSNPAYKYFSNI